MPNTTITKEEMERLRGDEREALLTPAHDTRARDLWWAQKVISARNDASLFIRSEAELVVALAAAEARAEAAERRNCEEATAEALRDLATERAAREQAERERDELRRVSAALRDAWEDQARAVKVLSDAGLALHVHSQSGAERHAAAVVEQVKALPDIVARAFNAGVVWQSDDRETLSTRVAAENRALASARAALSTEPKP